MTDQQFQELMAELRWQRSTFNAMAEGLEEISVNTRKSHNKKAKSEEDEKDEEDNG